MEANSNDNYVLVLEDHTKVKNQQEAGKLSIVSGIDDKGKLKTTEPLEANQAAFLKQQGWTAEELHDQLSQAVQQSLPLWAIQGVGEQCGARRR